MTLVKRAPSHDLGRSATSDDPARTVLAALERYTHPDLGHVIFLISANVGRPIHIRVIGDEAWETVTGLVIDFGTHFVILVRDSDPLLYQLHCVLHEASHVLLRHPTCAVGDLLRNSSGIGLRMRTPFPNLNLLHGIDDVTQQDLEIERQAEQLAYEFAQRIITTTGRHESRLG